MEYFLMILLLVVAIFLILLVLIQRGRGGGLAGAFGGLGGQSAFGTKAGDVFTRVTIITATIWILLCAVSVKILSKSEDKLAGDIGGDTPSAEKVEKPGAAGGKEDKAASPAAGKVEDKSADAKSDSSEDKPGSSDEKSSDKDTSPAPPANEGKPAPEKKK